MFKVPRDVPFSCRCGTIQGTLRGASRRSGTHVHCHCTDCRAAEMHAADMNTTEMDRGNSDPAPGPVSLFQVPPDRIQIDQGHDRIAVFSFGQTNILRWYAGCCGSILCNTLRNPKIAFASIRTDLLSDPDVVGPPVVEAFLPATPGKSRHRGMGRFVWQAFGRIAGARLSGKWRDTPLFDPETLAPIAQVTLVSPQDRKALLDRLR